MKSNFGAIFSQLPVDKVHMLLDLSAFIFGSDINLHIKRTYRCENSVFINMLANKKFKLM